MDIHGGVILNELDYVLGLDGHVIQVVQSVSLWDCSPQLSGFRP